MIGKIKKNFSNVIMLVLLLALGIGVFLFLNNRSQNSELAAQVSNSKLTPTPIAEKPSPTPTIQKKVTPTPIIISTEPVDDRPEPTWTPVIVLPDATSPPDPTPIPTPTATPNNPRESELIVFDAPASLGEISPDGKMLAFNRLQVEIKGNPYNQVWLLDLASKQTTKLVENGMVATNQVWAPDGKKLAYQHFSPNGFLEEVSIKEIDKKSEYSLLKNEDLLGYYWIDSEKMGLIRASSIDEVDLAGKMNKKRVVKLPTGNLGPTNFRPKPKITGTVQNIIMVIEDGKLRSILSDGQEMIFQSENGEWIYDFALAPNGKQVAYVAPQDTGSALWVSEVGNNNQRKLFERTGKNEGSIHHLVWSPDNQAIVVGWNEFGTSQDTFLTWIDIESGQARPLEIHGAIGNIIFSPDGQSLFYSRIFSPDDTVWGKASFYQLQVK